MKDFLTWKDIKEIATKRATRHPIFVAPSSDDPAPMWHLAYKIGEETFTLGNPIFHLGDALALAALWNRLHKADEFATKYNKYA